MGWLWLRCLPILGNLLTVWTPLVLIAAFAAGETLVNAGLHAVRAASARLCGESGKEPTPPAGAEGSILVPQAEESPASLGDGHTTRLDTVASGPSSLKSGLLPAE